MISRAARFDPHSVNRQVQGLCGAGSDQQTGQRSWLWRFDSGRRGDSQSFNERHDGVRNPENRFGDLVFWLRRTMNGVAQCGSSVQAKKICAGENSTTATGSTTDRDAGVYWECDRVRTGTCVSQAETPHVCGKRLEGTISKKNESTTRSAAGVEESHVKPQWDFAREDKQPVCSRGAPTDSGILLCF